MMSSCLITLLRHGLCVGEADSETEFRYVGHTDAPLTGEGRAQLAQMRGDYLYPPPDTLFTSPLRRCKESADILYPGAVAIELDGLKEYFFGEFENKTPQELERHPLFQRWIAGEPGLVPPFAEDLERFQSRICDTFARVADGLLKTHIRHAVIITHGGVIMALMAAFALPEAPMHEWLTPSGCGFTLRADSSIWHRGRKCEAIADVPGVREQDAGDRAWNERVLWKELEETDFV